MKVKCVLLNEAIWNLKGFKLKPDKHSTDNQFIVEIYNGKYSVKQTCIIWVTNLKRFSAGFFSTDNTNNMMLNTPTFAKNFDLNSSPKVVTKQTRYVSFVYV